MLGCKVGSPSQVLDRLVGQANEVEVILEGRKCTALLDTGAMVSTLSLSLCKDLGLEIEPLGNLVQVEGAGGHTLQYLGYTEARIEFPDLSASIDALFLVAPDTERQGRVPVLIGTNLLNAELFTGKEHTGQSIPASWHIAFQSVARHRSMAAQMGTLGTVKTTKEVTIPPSTRTVVHGLTRAGMAACQRLNVMLDEPEESPLPGGLMMSPCLLHLEPEHAAQCVGVEISNYSEKPVTIPANRPLCDVFQVTVVPPDKCEADMRRTGCTGRMALGSERGLFEEHFTPYLRQHLTPVQVEEVCALVNKWKHVFSQHDMDLGHTSLTRHRIRLKPGAQPFKERHRRIPPSMVDEVRSHLQEMLDLGVIRKSQSPYSSAVVLVKKKDQSLRFCIDLRRLNQQTVPDSYAIPRIEETLDALHGAKWFSVLDLKSSYWQVEVEESDRHLTAFQVGTLGFFECNRMPFGLSNAPATFQRLMETCMGDHYLNYCLLYLDDIVVFSETYEEHMERLEAVFQRLGDAGLKLKPAKCRLFQKSIKYLGHVVSEHGVSTDPDKIAAVKAWPKPQNISEVQSFLGFVSFYRRFIPKFSKVARPLHKLVQESGASGQKKRRMKNLPFCWGPEQQAAFEELIRLVTAAPVLAFADYTKPYVLHTDASGDGLGAVLYQKQDGLERVIAYASRGLSNAERNYPAHKLEFLALKWAVCEKFHDYLYGSEFTARTDNNPLTYVLTSAKLDATGQRWVSHLANYRFDIEYRSGKQNVDADALSRIQWPSVNALLEARHSESAPVEMMCLSQQVVPDNEGDLVARPCRYRLAHRTTRRIL